MTVSESLPILICFMFVVLGSLFVACQSSAMCVDYGTADGGTTNYKPRTRTMLIIDAHLDLAWNALDWNRDLTQSAAEIRRREIAEGIRGKGRGEGTVSFPELRRGGVGLFIATLLARLMRPDL